MFACIYIPDFAVQAACRLEPALAAQPVAVVEGRHPVLSVCSLNDSARAMGLKPGMTKLQAEQFAGVVIRERAPDLEAEVSSALLECAGKVSPRVEAAENDAVIAEINGLSHLFGSTQEIAKKLYALLVSCGLHGNIATAANPDAAMLAARGFAGITVIPAGGEAHILGGLPVALLRPSKEISAILENWGIQTFTQLAALPAIPLSERLGQEGLRLQQLARGAVMRPLLAASAALRFEELIELEDAIQLLEPLAFVLARLLNRICERLQEHALAASQLYLELGLEDKSVHQRSVKLPVPLRNSSLFLKLLTLDLEAHPPRAAIVKVLLRAEPAPPQHSQNGLFGASTPVPEKLELTLARIANLVGEGNVGSAELLDTHRPQAFRMARFRVRLHSEGNSSKSAMQFGRRKKIMGLRIFRPNRKARVWSKHGRPQTLSSGGMRSKVLAAAGPWMGSGGWWEQRSWAREEWDVELEQGWFRIYHDLVNGGWYMEGSYD